MSIVAVVLSGCGYLDGSEIQESVVTLLTLDGFGVPYQCMAPNMLQRRVVNHLTGEVQADASRNVLEEAARIARGDVLDMSKVDATDYCAAIYPGGFGAALNLCDFAEKGAGSHLHPDVLTFGRAMAKAHKPQGFICIAPSLITGIYGVGVQMTVGNKTEDEETISTLVSMGNRHVPLDATEMVYDEAHRVLSTPAYMNANSLSEVQEGIRKMVQQIVELVAHPGWPRWDKALRR